MMAAASVTSGGHDHAAHDDVEIGALEKLREGRKRELVLMTPENSSRL